MKSNLRSWAVVAVFAMMVTGCSIYHPQSVDIPMINHAGDTRVDANVALSTWVLPDVLTAGATVSYGFNDWLAGQAHLNFGGDNVYGQVAPGAYLPLGEHGLLEGYVGMGMGGAWRSRSVSSSDTSTYNYDYSGRFSIPFGQVNIGWHDLSAAHIDLALGLKAGAYMPVFAFRRYSSESADVPTSTDVYTTPSALLEPQLMFRIGSESAKFCVRLSYAWLSDFYSESGSGHFTADLFTLSAGVNFSL